MKKIMAVVLCVILFLSSFSTDAFATIRLDVKKDQDITLQNSNDILQFIDYSVNDKKVSIIACDQSFKGELVIPETIDGYPVTEINGWAFSACKDITSVKMPNSIVDIGQNAFEYCDNLSTVELSENLLEIRYRTFYCCYALSSIEIPDSVMIVGSSAFYGTAIYNNDSNWDENVLYVNNHLIATRGSISGKYTIKDNTKTIADGSFHECQELTNVIFPSSLKSIGEAFNYCTGLTEINIPTNVELIGWRAFEGCSNLSFINLPDTVKEIEHYAFVDTAFFKDDNNWENGALYVGKHLIATNESISKDFVVKPGTKTISGSAFYPCYTLENLTIPNSVIKISDTMFEGCDGLKSITVDKQNDNYSSCDGVLFNKNKTEVLRYPPNKTGDFYSIPNSVIEIAPFTFEKSDFTEVDIPGNVTKIGHGAFSNSSLMSVTIPSKVTDINYSTFNQCHNLSVVVLHDNITSIGSSAFAGCLIKTINMPDELQYLGAGAFQGCEELQDVKFSDKSDKLEKIYERAFAGCSKLTSIELPDSIIEIDHAVFEDCINLVEIKLSQNIENIVWGAFYNTGYYNDKTNWKDGLLYLNDCLYEADDTISGDCVIKVGTRLIAEEAFYYCDSLKSIVIPDSVKFIGDDAFEKCNTLESITLPFIGLRESDDLVLADIFGGGKYNYNYVPSSLKTVILSDNCKEIPDYAFWCCENITDIVLGNSILKIGKEAFYNCKGITSLNIPNSVIGLGEFALSCCENLKSVNIPNKVEIIPEALFAYCYNLEKIEIPNGVREIGSSAFDFCKSLTEIIIPDSVDTIGRGAFSRCDGLQVITIPFIGQTMEDLDFSSIFNGDPPVSLKTVTISSKCTRIGGFWGCTTIEEVIVPNTAEKISSFAFRGCTSLKEINIPNSVKTIGEYAFEGCSNLTELNIPNYVISIGDYAFSRCDSLLNLVIGSGTTEFGDYLLAESNNLKSITLPQTIGMHLSNLWGFTGNYNGGYVPDTLENITVSEPCAEIIEDYFRGCPSIREVVLPNSLKSIQHRAFEDCTNLVQISLPDSIEKISGSAFYNTGYYNEENNWQNDTLYIDNHLMKVKDSFNGKLELKEGTKSIASNAICYCDNITDIILPDGLVGMENSISGCQNVKSIFIPSSVKHLSKFDECYNLESIAVSENNPYYSSIDGVLFNKNKSILIDYPCGHLSLEYVVPNDVKIISDGAFSFSKTEKITIPEGVEIIKSGAFAFSSILNINIPDSVTSIGTGVFDYTSFENCLYIDNHLICGQDVSGTLRIKEGIRTIANSAFEWNSNISTVIIPDSVIKIGDSAFEGCGMENIAIGGNVQHIGKEAFSNCYNLASIKIPEKVKSIESSTFYGCTKLTDITLPSGLVTIDDWAFNQCKSLESIIIPRGVTKIGEAAFIYCDSLINIALPNSLSIIENSVFRDCDALTTIFIPEGIKTIDSFAFYDCNNLEAIVIPTTIKNIGEEAFAWCSNLQNVKYAGNNEDRNGITICDFNEYFENSTWDYNHKHVEHTYSSSCDTTCDCGYVREATHIFDHACDTDCNICGVTRTITHDYAVATCTTPQTCKVCGKTTGSTLEHTYDKQVVADKYLKSAASCSSAATYYKSCECGAKGTTTFTNGSKLSHKSDSGTVTKKATCTATGTKTYKCTLCKATIKTETIAKVAHKYDSGKVTKAATCKATGVKTYTCSVCKGTKTETIAKLTTHTYSNNCDKSCNVCGKTRTVGAHKYSNNCDATCNYCNAKRTIKHTYSNNCDTSCNVCKATRTITHSYKTTTTKATLTKNGSIVKKCTVCGKVASKSTIKYVKSFKLSTTTYTYDGKVKTPSVTVKDSAGKTLKKNTDYTVTYASGRKNVGTYKVTIKMKGKYSGTKTLTFKINPAKTTVSKLTAGKKSITVAITKRSTQVTGYQIQYSTSKSFSKATTKTISSYKTTKYTLKSLSAKKTYYVRVRTYKTVGKTKYYSGWSTYKYVKTK